MTREEALKIVRENYPHFGTSEPWLDLEKALATLIPELRESEDERIYNEIMEFFRMNEKRCIVDNSYTKWIAWLEKQKETANSFTDGVIEVRSFQRGIAEGRRLERQKEQKHPNGCFTCDEYKKGYEEGRRNGFTAGYNKAMKEVEQKEQKPVVTLGETYHVDTLGTQQVIAGKMPQKPAEWSEEDEEMLNSCISSIEEAKENRYAYKETDGDTSYDHEIDWLKSLRPQQKVEWSEEDEEMFQEALTDIIYAKNELNKKGCEGLAKSALDAFNWLNMRFKSLHYEPKQEWDTHDKAIVNCIVCCLDGQFVSEAARKQSLEWFNKHRRDFLNRPSWKPSEAQLMALHSVIDNESDTIGNEQQKLLYNDLKKLI